MGLSSHMEHAKRATIGEALLSPQYQLWQKEQREREFWALNYEAEAREEAEREELRNRERRKAAEKRRRLSEDFGSLITLHPPSNQHKELQTAIRGLLLDHQALDTTVPIRQALWEEYYRWNELHSDVPIK